MREQVQESRESITFENAESGKSHSEMRCGVGHMAFSPQTYAKRFFTNRHGAKSTATAATEPLLRFPPFFEPRASHRAISTILGDFGSFPAPIPNTKSLYFTDGKL